MGVDQQSYRAVIGHLATGVTVITGRDDRGPVGMTANAVCSLSLEPLLVLVCFDNTARTLPIVQAQGRFAINVLSTAQHELAGIFASKLDEQEKFRGIAHTILHGVPVIEGALAWLACDLRELHAGGDHTIGIGEVTDLAHAPSGDPLIWFRGHYTTAAQ